MGLDELAKVGIIIVTAVGALYIYARIGGDGLYHICNVYENIQNRRVKTAILNGQPPFKDGQLCFDFRGDPKFEQHYYESIRNKN